MSDILTSAAVGAAEPAGPIYLLYTLICCAGFGIGTAMQKHGMAASFPKLTFKTLFSRFGEILKTIATNWIWTLGVVVQLTGGLFYLLAISTGDITIVQPLINLTIVFAMLIGVFILKESIAANEIAGVLVMLTGAIILGIAAPASAVKRINSETYLVFSIVALIAIFVCGAAGQALKSKFNPSYFLSATSGLCFGLGMTLTNALMISMPEFSAEAPAAFAKALFTSYELGPIVVLNIVGFVLFQMAFSHGRVSIISPINNIVGAIPPVVAGFTVFYETAGMVRIAGIVTVLLGTAILVMKPESAEAPIAEQA